jgi:hypothetical protein
MCAQDLRVVAVLRPPDLNEQGPVGHEPPTVAHERTQQVELDRREVDLLAVAAHDPRVEVHVQPVDLDGRLPGRVADAPQRGAEPRHQLARAEGLGHVVVGAGLERLDLCVLLAHRAEHEDGHRRPLAQAAGELDAAAVGEHEVDDGGVRRAHGGAVERLLHRGGLDHVVAGLAQDDLQRAQDLALVVDHEHPGEIAHAGSSGSSTTKLDPWPGSDSTHTRPPLASTKPRTIARPSPEPRWPLAAPGAR